MRFRRLLPVLLLLPALALSACAASDALTPTPAWTAAPTVAPTPVVTLETALAAPVNDSNVPDWYTRVSDGVYAFTDETGTVAYRASARVRTLTDGAETASKTVFFAVDSPDTAAIPLSPDAAPADPALDQPGRCAPEAIPEGTRVRSAYTATGRTGHYAVDGGFVVYGRFPGGEAAFYPADGEGNMLPGALAAEAPVLIPAYTPETPPAEGETRMLVVFIGTQSVVSFRAENGELTEERVMICSTGRNKDATPRGTFHIMQQYRYKKLGMNGENYYGQYSSRIVGNYLFHSVPISGPEPQNKENGKRQLIVKYYEKLGTPASGGCIRLRVIDALWIYTNCEVGTTVVITDDAGPAPEQPAPLIQEEPYVKKKNGLLLGWDPTDPDPNNPYREMYPPEDWAIEAFNAYNEQGK